MASSETKEATKDKKKEKDATKKKKVKEKKKKKKGNAMDAFKASIMAQKAEEEQKAVDVDAILGAMTDSKEEAVAATHARTTTETILAQLGASFTDEDAVEHDDNAEVDFLRNLNAYLGNDFVAHKRSMSTISNSSAKSQHSHGRSGTLFSLSHTRTRKESMQLILKQAKIENTVRTKEMLLFDLIADKSGIEKLEIFLQNEIDLHLLWSFLDVVLFRIIKYRKEQDDKREIGGIYFSIFEHLNQKKFLQNGCFMQYVKFLSCSNSESKDIENPLALFLDYLLLFEAGADANKALLRYDFEKDKLILAWEYIANQGYKSVDEIDVDSKDFDFYDPIRCNFDFKNCSIQKVIIRKVFNSANRPLLLDIYCSDDSLSSVVLKKGDDLRKDKALMNIFKFMNYIWMKESKKKESKYKLEYKKRLVKILTFNVVSITNKLGIIELVANCIPLRHINRYVDELIDEHFVNLVSSAAASYIGSFVCGVKDRHFDNILLRTEDCTLFHIDFGYCLGESIKNPFAIDTSIFAITEDFYNIIGKQAYEEYFVDLCVDSYLCLRKYYKELVDFTMLSFSYLFKEKHVKKVEGFLMKKLKVKDDEEKVKEWLKSAIKKAPFSKKTKLKNKLHRINAPTLTDDDLQSVEKTP